MRRGARSIARLEHFLGEAAQIFGADSSQLQDFVKRDPLNPDNEMSRKEGPMGGSLLITEVNGKRMPQPLLIYGTPKLVYPYRSTEATDFLDFATFADAKSCFFGNKWDGTNVLFFRYTDADGNVFISGKTKGSAFLNDSQYGAFLTLTTRALKLRKGAGALSLRNLPPMLRQLSDSSVQSKSFELCGTEEPHLVAYDFPLELKPLYIFVGFFHEYGSIAPAAGENADDVGPLPFKPVSLAEECKSMQQQMLQVNEAFRTKRNLPHRYERGHFAVEGRVMYLLDEKGRLLNRTMYKVKPSDVEEVHWSSFDATMQGRVREVVEKIRQREKQLNEQTLQEELDMGPKEWARFGKEVLSYAMRLGETPTLAEDTRRVLFICGEGESLAATHLAADGWRVLSAESDAPHALLAALKRGNDTKAVVCGTMTAKQRHPWLRATQELGVLNVSFMSFASSERLPSKRDGFTAIATSPKPYAGQGAQDVLVLIVNKQPEATVPASNTAVAHP